MTTITPEVRSYASERFAPAAQAALQLAQREAAHLHSAEVSPELLLFGVLLQGDSGTRKVLSHLGINLEALRARVREIFNLPHAADNESPLDYDLSLSADAHYCISWSMTFAINMHDPLVRPEHLLLGSLRHPRTQPLLALLLPAEGALPAPVIEEREQDYPSSMDQLIHGRVRAQSLVSLSDGESRQMLRGFERPTLLFADIAGDAGAKRELQQAVDFLRIPRLTRRQEKNYLCGMVLVGSHHGRSSMLVRAVAGEAVVPLLSLSISALVGMLRDIADGAVQLEDFDLSEEEFRLLEHGDIVQRGRHMIGFIFAQARKSAPCVLLLDELDAIDRLSGEEERRQWLRQVLVEMDYRDNHPSMVVIAATEHPDTLDEALLHPARFEQLVVLEDSAFTHDGSCPACAHTTQAGWKHCMYCATTLARVCPHCSTRLPELAGTRYCCECGGALFSN